MASNADSINKKLIHEEEWVKNFESHVKKSAQLREQIEELSDNFLSRLVSLEENVLPMHETNGKLQLKQHNIQRLIKTIDATIQFYGRTSDLENYIKDGSPGHAVKTYLDNMESLQQAIKFFETHPNYRNQTENMKNTLETGYTILEREYRNVVQRNTMQAAPAILTESLDDQYELMGNRAKELKTMKSIDEVAMLGVWLLERGRSRFLVHYADIRGDTMMRTVEAVAQHFALAHAKTNTKSQALKTALRKAAGARGERAGERGEGAAAAGEAEGVLLVAGCLLALLEVEETVMQKTIPDTTKRAQVFRELVARPLDSVVRRIARVVQEVDTGVIPLLPLLRFLSHHHTRLQNLAANSTADIPFDALMRNLRIKASTYLNEFVEKLRYDANKFVPLDGNVHPVTANTLNFLVVLSQYRHTVSQQLLSLTAGPGENASLLLPKLFARVLSALGQTLKKKSENYDDTTLSVVFLLNNYNHIANALLDGEDALLPVINEQNTHIVSFYQGEIAQCIQLYMKSWNSTVSTLNGWERVRDDRNQIKNMITNFTREFDQTCSLQRNYCISDVKLAQRVRNRIRESLDGYDGLLEKTRGTEQAFAKYVKYTEDSLRVAIDRVFDVLP